MPTRSLPVESRSRRRPSGAGFRRTATQMALSRCAIAHRGPDWSFWRGTPAIACVAAQPPCSWHLPEAGQATGGPCPALEAKWLHRHPVAPGNHDSDQARASTRRSGCGSRWYARPFMAHRTRHSGPRPAQSEEDLVLASGVSAAGATGLAAEQPHIRFFVMVAGGWGEVAELADLRGGQLDAIRGGVLLDFGDALGPGIWAMSSPFASSQARATCAGVAPVLGGDRFDLVGDPQVVLKFSPVKRGLVVASRHHRTARWTGSPR